MTLKLLVLILLSLISSFAQAQPRFRAQAAVDSRVTADASQVAGLRRLRAASLVPARFSLERGAIRFAALAVRVPSSAGTGSVAHANWFLNQHRAALRLKNTSTELQLTRISRDQRFVFFRRRHLGIPVFPGGIGVHLDGRRVRALAGNYVPEIDTSPVPRLSAERAEELAKEFDKSADGTFGETSLRFVNLGLLGFDDQTTHLAWRINLTSHKTMYIDAHTGARLYTSTRATEGFDLELDNSNGNGPRSGWPCGGEERWFDELGVVKGASPDAEGLLAFDNIRTVYNYFHNTFGRDALDNDGDDIEVYVHVGNNWTNAHYVGPCDLMEFGDGYPVNDVMAHEYTHGIDDYEAELEYANESGALDESFADIFGHFVDNGDWLIGEDTPSGRARDMSHPPNRAHPDRYNSPLKLPNSNDPEKSNDFGGVHSNSGINNKAAFLLTAGGTFNSFNVRGIGRSKAQQLFYAVHTGWLWDSSRMIDARDGAVQYASFWASTGTDGFTSDDVCQVRNAYAAVELGGGDRDCDGFEDSEDPDNDGDGVSDRRDNCRNIANPGQWDADNDGQGDACDTDVDGDGLPADQDNCPNVSNPDQADFDRDGLGDKCENSDGDYYGDAFDNCPQTPNNDQTDTDRDGKGDACDVDDDGDMIGDTQDNCQFTPNTAQTDSDNDRVGNACDLCPGVRSSDNRDTDGDGRGNPCDTDDDNDGVLDTVDNCRLVYNPEQFDSDNDGVGFACDPGEREWFKHLSSLKLRGTFLFDVPLCPQCGFRIPNDYEEVIIVEAPQGFDVRIVNNDGKTVADGQRGASKHVLKFQPGPHASAIAARLISSTAPGISASASLGVGASSLAVRPTTILAPRRSARISNQDEVRYYLVVTPSPKADPNQTYRVSVTFNGAVRRS